MSCTYRTMEISGGADHLDVCYAHNKPSKYNLITEPNAPCMAVDPLTAEDIENMPEGQLRLIEYGTGASWNAFQHLDSQDADVVTHTTNPVEGIIYTTYHNRPGARPVNVFVDDVNPQPPEE
jgi:hypothetical protein